MSLARRILKTFLKLKERGLCPGNTRVIVQETGKESKKKIEKIL